MLISSDVCTLCMVRCGLDNEFLIEIVTLVDHVDLVRFEENLLMTCFMVFPSCIITWKAFRSNAFNIISYDKLYACYMFANLLVLRF